MVDHDRTITATALRPSRRDYVIEGCFMPCALVPVLISAYASLKTGERHWFQRSGALIWNYGDLLFS